MKELISINYETDHPSVSARDLHDGLEIGTKFATWFPRMIEYGFKENIDYETCYPKMGSENHGGQNMIDYQISVDMAKQICMIQRTEKGKMYRQYFLDLEKAWNTPEQIMARALRMADKTIEEQKEQIRQMKPKALFADAVATSSTSILIGELAKIICQNGYSIGQKRLFKWMRDNGYLMRQGSSYNMPKQRFVEQGLFEIKESSVQNPDGSVRITKTPKVTGKGQCYFVNKFLGEKEGDKPCQGQLSEEGSRTQ